MAKEEIITLFLDEEYCALVRGKFDCTNNYWNSVYAKPFPSNLMKEIFNGGKYKIPMMGNLDSTKDVVTRDFTAVDYHNHETTGGKVRIVLRLGGSQNFWLRNKIPVIRDYQSMCEALIAERDTLFRILLDVNRVLESASSDDLQNKTLISANQMTKKIKDLSYTPSSALDALNRRG